LIVVLALRSFLETGSDDVMLDGSTDDPSGSGREELRS
jgi:hypothetical protein